MSNTRDNEIVDLLVQFSRDYHEHLRLTLQKDRELVESLQTENKRLKESLIKCQSELSMLKSDIANNVKEILERAGWSYELFKR